MKILDILVEGKTWTEAGWIGGASDEGHDDFDPMQQANGGYISRPYARPYRAPAAPMAFVAIRVPFAVKDAFKEVAGKGNYAWDGDHKTWKIKTSLLTPQMRQRLGDMGIEVPR
jgi:hypothetical protein